MIRVALGCLFLSCTLLLGIADDRAYARTSSDQRTIGLSSIGWGDDDQIHLGSNPISIYVYLNNPGEDLKSIEFGLDFDYLGSSSAPLYATNIVNLITGESVSDYSPELDAIRLEWTQCLQNQVRVTVARLDLYFLFSSWPPGLICLGPSAEAEAGTAAPTYLACDRMSGSCLGPADTEQLTGVITMPFDSGTPPGCIVFETLEMQDFGNELPWECEGSYTTVPVGERSWSTFKAGWQR